MGRTLFVLHSALTPNAVADALRSSIDEERWLAFAVLVGTPIFVRTVTDIVTGSHYMSGDKWVGLLVPPGLVLFGTVLPKVGRLLGKSNERFILEHVQNTLAARIEDVA